MRDRTRIAWAITGAGHNLEACADFLLQHPNVDIFLSRAAEEVVRIYSLEARLKASQVRIYHERLSSAPLVVRLFRGDYKILVVAPATSNSVAKFVCGISDTLVTNMFAQAGKSRVPIVAASRVAARVTAVRVHAGDWVKPSDVLVELDSADLRAHLREAGGAAGGWRSSGRRLVSGPGSAAVFRLVCGCRIARPPGTISVSSLSREDVVASAYIVSPVSAVNRLRSSPMITTS